MAGGMVSGRMEAHGVNSIHRDGCRQEIETGSVECGGSKKERVCCMTGAFWAPYLVGGSV
jgi:hypothetical protein